MITGGADSRRQIDVPLVEAARAETLAMIVMREFEIHFLHRRNTRNLRIVSPSMASAFQKVIWRFEFGSGHVPELVAHKVLRTFEMPLEIYPEPVFPPRAEDVDEELGRIYYQEDQC